MSKKVIVNGEEMEIEEEAHPVAAHFQKSISQIELEKKLAYYLELTTEIEALTATKDALRKEILEAGKGEESLMAGNYVAFFKAVKGRTTVDWQGYAKAQLKDIPAAELEPYTKRGEDSVRVEVKRIG